MSTQTNVQQGAIVVVAGEDLSSKEGYLVELYNDAGTAKARVPTSNDVQQLYLLDDDGESGANVTLLPLESGKSFRIEFEGTGAIGDIVVLADTAVAGDRGKVRELPTAAGTYRGLGWLEEAAVDGQQALVRCSPQGNVTVTE